MAIERQDVLDAQTIAATTASQVDGPQARNVADAMLDIINRVLAQVALIDTGTAPQEVLDLVDNFNDIRDTL
jgi:hypothetical protein